MAKVTPSHSSPICVWRYSLWIPLYPIGFICEGVIAYKSIIYLEETQRWVWKKWKIATTTIPLEARFSLLLPNSWNIGFHPPNLIRFYLLFGFFPMLYNQMCHMYNLRFQLEQQFKILPLWSGAKSWDSRTSKGWQNKSELCYRPDMNCRSMSKCLFRSLIAYFDPSAISSHSAQIYIELYSQVGKPLSK